MQLLSIIRVAIALCCINLAAWRIITSGHAASVVVLAFRISAVGVFSTVSLWMEEFAHIAFLTRWKMKAIFAMVEHATLIAVEATRAVPTFLVGRLSVALVWTSYLGIVTSVMHSMLRRYDLELARAETVLKIVLGLVQLQSLKLILDEVVDRVAGTLFRGALVEIASVYRKLLANLAHEVVAFLGHAWVAQITLLSLLELHLRSRLQDCLTHCDGGGDLFLLRHLLLRLKLLWLRLRRPQLDPLLQYSLWR